MMARGSGYVTHHMKYVSMLCNESATSILNNVHYIACSVSTHTPLQYALRHVCFSCTATGVCMLLLALILHTYIMFLGDCEARTPFTDSM
jgi:hypothetical protein